ncbi:glycosyltransferase [Glutamicibacter sp. AOP33-2CA-4]|uniref:glycosyltransferase n=1 Tax=Glutamicibacter sp. AOP33-2CA-4 TaxID=3457690 RepID=UPI0040336094
MESSKRSFGSSTASRAQLFSIRQRYEKYGDDIEYALLTDLAKYEAQNVTLKSENETLRKQSVKLNGSVALYETKFKKTEAERQKFSRMAATLKTQLTNEHARAEKFKLAYENLRDHPVVRAARGLKSPFSKKPTTTLPAATAIAQKALTPVVPDSLSVNESESVEPSLQQIAKLEVEKYRDLGEVTEPANTLRELLAVPEAPKNFGPLHLQIMGQERLLKTLPDLPPKSSSPAYVPQVDKVMYCAHSTGEFNSNGYSTRTTGLTKAVTDAGMDLFIAARPGYPWDSKVTKKAPSQKRLIRDFQGVKTHFNPGVSLRNDPLDKFIQLAADIYVREAMMNRPAVIVSASNHITALPALIAARRLGIPFIYEVRGLWEITAAAGNDTWLNSERFELARNLESLVANEADQIFAITEEVREELVSRGATKANISILPNAANIFQYVPLPAERSSVVTKKVAGEFLLGYAGSIVSYEGLDQLVESIAGLPEEFNHVSALIVGDGQALPALKQQVAELGLEERIRFTGRVPNEKINDYLAIFDAVVCPRNSNIVTELVSPLKPIEAMAAGRPVIGSDVSPIATLLGTDSERGLLFAADNVDSLSEQIKKLALDPKLGQNIGRRARQWTVETRTWPIVAQTFTEQVRTAQKRTVAGKKLKDIRMAIIADEFTTSTLKREVNLVAPTPDNWRQVLAAQPIDVLFVESAWAGNSESWTRKVGYYDDDQCSDLDALTKYCRKNGIPTIFWNKEDPVHFNRFRRTAKLFDVVLTTDANCLEDYWENRGGYMRALGSLPFWAQAEIHNPLGSIRPYSHSVAYGGSYYGERYAERSQELRLILEGARKQGLTIYDRQADNPESPYKFPTALQPFVQGGLTYDQMVEAYKSHPVHVNVNSVNGSPTMFSRRVYEIAACGTPLISGKSFGVTWMFDGTVPVVRSREESELITSLWMQSEADRVTDAWAPMRVTFQRHLAHHRLALALRMAGIAVEIPTLPTLGLELEKLDAVVAGQILATTIRPSEVYVAQTEENSAAMETLKARGIRTLDPAAPRQAEVSVSRVQDVLADSDLFEDLLIAYQYGGASSVEASEKDLDVRGLSLWLKDEPSVDSPLLKMEQTNDPSRDVHLRLRRPLGAALPKKGLEESISQNENVIPQNVVIAGHDLKFAAPIIQSLESHGHEVNIHKWVGHAMQDGGTKPEFVEDAEIIFCEWSLGNLAWYSKNLKPSQRLVTRFHSQELFTDFPNQTNFNMVDTVIFVSDLVRGMAVQKFGIPIEKTIVVPNPVSTTTLDLPKDTDSEFVLGFVGMVPQMKRFDLVLDLLEALRATDERFTLRVKGKRPEEYPWMAARVEEMEFYEAQYARIEESPLLQGAVAFDPQGDDMAQWYQQIGVAVSTSDFESFHFTLADGAASRALPVGLAWPGSEWLYPKEWLFTDTELAAKHVAGIVSNQERFEKSVEEARAFTVENYDSKKIMAQLVEAIEAD